MDEVVPTKSGARAPRHIEQLAMYKLNLALVASMQSIGRSTKAATTVCGCLGLTSNTFNSRWTSVERVLGLAEVKITNEILKENRALETVGKTKLENGKYTIEASADMGWLGKASQRNSLAGFGHLILGQPTRLPMAYHVKVRHCTTCSRTPKGEVSKVQYVDFEEAQEEAIPCHSRKGIKRESNMTHA
jgi:hypothetical protein